MNEHEAQGLGAAPVYEHVNTWTLMYPWHKDMRYAAQGIVSDLACENKWNVNVDGIEHMLRAFSADACDGAQYITRAWHSDIEDDAENPWQADIRFTFYTGDTEKLDVEIHTWEKP